MDKADLLCGVAAVAAYLGMTETQARNLCRTGVIPTFRLGRKLCSRRSTCDALLAEREAEARNQRAHELEAA